MKLNKVMALAAIFAAVFLVGCESEPGSSSDIHTGVTEYHSSWYPAHSGLLSNLNVATFIGTRESKITYGVGTQYLSTGIGWSYFTEAWSFGSQLPFIVAGEELLGCGGGSCSMIEEGIVTLTRAQFDKAASEGLEFKLVGKSRSIVAIVPAAAFKEALEQFNLYR